MKKVFILTLLLSGIITIGAQAQNYSGSSESSAPIVYITENVYEQPDIIAVFNNTHSGYFRDPKAPRFIFVDQQGRWGLGIGGYVQTKAEYDFGGIVDNVDFLPSSIATGNQASSRYQMDASTSLIFLKLVGRSEWLGDFTVYTAGTWRGAGNTFKLHNAYMKFKYMTVGYNTGNFMDEAAVPFTLDYAGPNGMVFYRTVQAAFHYGFDWGLSMGIAFESPDVKGTSNEFAKVGKQRMPNIPVYFKYSWADNSHVRLSGILRDLSYDDLISGKNRQKLAWGAQATTLMTFGKLQLRGQYSIGEGIGSLFNDISNVGVDIAPNPNLPGKMMMMLTDGWYAGAQFNFTPKLFASATYSQSSVRSRNGYGSANPDNYKRGQYVAANMCYNLTDNLQLGVEYLHGWRVDYEGDTNNANRVNLSAQFNF
jgi:predicted porin